MTTAVANQVDRFAVAQDNDVDFRRFLVYSILLHAFLTLSIAVSAYLQYRGTPWGGVGGDLGGTKVSLVSSAGIPMPKPAVVTESQVVDPTKGLYKEEPPKPPEPKTDAAEIPKFEKEKRLPPSPKSRTFENKTPLPENAVLYGKGGSPDLPSGYSPAPGGASSGVSIQGQGGTDFASRYAWYIEAVKNRIYGNWQQWTIDAAARASRTMHCAITFTINRDGSVKDAHISESSGNSSYDNSALRAVLSSNPVSKLPNDYSGGFVIATLDFNPPGIR
jgi:periplasmic protein TonB